MATLIRLLTLFAIIVLVLVACNINNPPTSNPLLDQSVAPQSPAAILELTVQVDTSVPFNAVGQIIKYNYTVRNIGTAGVSGAVTVTGAAAVTCPPVNTTGNADDSLDVNETLVCTSEYAITQADLDKGSVTTITTASIGGVNSSPVTTTVTLVQTPMLTLAVVPSPSTYSQVDQVITYSYTIQNNGGRNIGPAQFTVSDGLIGSINCGPADKTLAPNDTVACTATYKITQANLNDLSIASTATASGGGALPSPSVTTTVNRNSNTTNIPGPTIQYQVKSGEWIWQIARCYGIDPKVLIADNKDKLPDPSKIQPGLILTVRNPSNSYVSPCVEYVTYTVQSGDTWNSIAQKYNVDPTVLKLANPTAILTAGNVLNLRIPRNSASTTPYASLTLTKTANPSTYDHVGQVITYTYIIKNSGNTTLGPTQFTVNDGLIGTFNCGAANTSLPINATVTCTATYTITQANLNDASITNTATASGAGVGLSPSTKATINRVGAAQLTLTTVANPTTYNNVGQQITYTYTIKNSGNVSLGPTQFTVNDGLIGIIYCSDANKTLAPNETVTCSSSYNITQANLNDASIASTATASGGGAQSASVTTTINKTAAASLALTVVPSSYSYDLAGMLITYNYIIRNSGNTTLGPAQFIVNDGLLGQVNCGAVNTILVPNSTVTCSAPYTITQANMNDAAISSTATASGGGVGPSPAVTTTIYRQ